MTGPTLVLSDEGILVEVARRGAELKRILVNDAADILWRGDPGTWADSSPLLFPVIGAAAACAGSPGDGPAMPSHGFLRGMMFDVVRADRSSCVLAASDDAATRALFPHSFEVRVATSLVGGGVEIKVRIANRGSGAMPFAFGFHPGFRLPARSESEYPMVTVDMPLPSHAWRMRQGMLTGERVALRSHGSELILTGSMFDAGGLLLPGLQATRARLRNRRDTSGIALTFANLPHLALWSLPGAGFLCVEPWSGLPPRVDGRQAETPALLASGETACFGFSARYERWSTWPLPSTLTL